MLDKAVTTSNAIPDVQNAFDSRHIPIQQVGVKGLRYPIRIETESRIQSSIATWNMMVQLPEDKKGTHMSRFVALLDGLDSDNAQPINLSVFKKMLVDMVELLEANEGRIEVSFPYFITKVAPVSEVKSLMDYEVGFVGEIINGKTEVSINVLIPVTSLCPCSKEISSYGAHNQRSHITANIYISDEYPIDALIAKIETQASCELYGLLKRPDEKFVTEKAYDNPKFVEDLVRDVAGVLNDDSRILAYTLEAENFESIHNHSAYAKISKDKRL